MVEQEKAVTKDKLTGMQVIDAQGHLLGTVKDVTFTVGKMGISLYVENKKGERRKPKRRMGGSSSRRRLHNSEACDSSCRSARAKDSATLPNV